MTARPMTDDELAHYLGIADDPLRAKFIAALSPKKRALFDRMSVIEAEIDLWQQDLGPKPTGVLIDSERATKRRRAWR